VRPVTFSSPSTRGTDCPTTENGIPTLLTLTWCAGTP